MFKNPPSKNLNHAVILGKAIVIPPLQTIQIQMEKICQSWQIPFLNLSDIARPEEIPEKMEELNPKIILCSIEDISNEQIQSKLQLLDVSYVAIDECQVIQLNLFDFC